MRIADLKIGQKVSINGKLAEYQGIQKIKVSNFGKVEKRVFRFEDKNDFKYYNINDGNKPLETEKITLVY